MDVSAPMPVDRQHVATHRLLGKRWGDWPDSWEGVNLIHLSHCGNSGLRVGYTTSNQWLTRGNQSSGLVREGWGKAGVYMT